MPSKQIGIAVLAFGTVDEVWGYAETIDIGQEAEKKVVQNGDGDTKGVIYTDLKQKVSGEFTPLAVTGQSATSPVTDDDLIGKELTIKTMGSQTIKCIVESATLKLKKGDVGTWSFEGYRYPNINTGS